MEEEHILIDGIQRNKENPDTFEIPSQEEKDSVKKGNFVKIGFLFKNSDGGERMWVLLTKKKPDGTMEGTLANDPVLFIGMLSHGDIIKFEEKNILSILNQDDSEDGQ